MNPKMFLTGDPSDLKETLDGLVKPFGDKLLLNKVEISQIR